MSIEAAADAVELIFEMNVLTGAGFSGEDVAKEVIAAFASGKVLYEINYDGRRGRLPGRLIEERRWIDNLRQSGILVQVYPEEKR